MNGNLADAGVRQVRKLVVAQVLLVVAILGAGYLAVVSLSHGLPAGCGAGSGCDAVLQSRWAYWLGLPVSVPAVLAYVAMLGASVLALKSRSPDDERGAWVCLVILSIVVAGAAAWFVGLQVFVLHAFCKFCLAVHACGLTAAMLCLAGIPVAEDPTTPLWATGSGKRGVPVSGLAALVLIGLAGVGVLAGGQYVLQPQRNVVVVGLAKTNRAATGVVLTGNGATNGAGVVTRANTNAPTSPNVQLTGPRLLSIYDGQFTVRLDEVPILGSPGASNVIVYLFDYTCPHCRELHAVVTETQRQLSNQLAVVALPMPMSTNCNPFIPGNFVSASNSCDYARIGLAVWRLRPAEYGKFDDWFFKPKEPPSVEEARKYASELLGAGNLENAMADPWIDQQILTDCRLHAANWAASGRPAMPQILLGQAISVGPLNGVEHLMVLLNRYLGLDTLSSGLR